MFLFIPATRIRVSVRWRAFIRTSWGSLQIAQDRFRSKFGQFKLCAYFLRARTKSFNLLLLVRDVRLELLLLLCRSRLEILPFFATVTSKFSTLLADAVVDVSTVRNARPRW